MSSLTTEFIFDFCFVTLVFLSFALPPSMKLKCSRKSLALKVFNIGLMHQSDKPSITPVTLIPFSLREMGSNNL